MRSESRQDWVSSSMKSGLPSARSMMEARMSPGRSAPAARLSTSVEEAAASSRLSASTSTASRHVIAESSLVVATVRMAPGPRSTRRPSSARVDGSAQWRSSTRNRCGVLAASAASQSTSRLSVSSRKALGSSSGAG